MREEAVEQNPSLAPHVTIVHSGLAKRTTIPKGQWVSGLPLNNDPTCKMMRQHDTSCRNMRIRNELGKLSNESCS